MLASRQAVRPCVARSHRGEQSVAHTSKVFQHGQKRAIESCWAWNGLVARLDMAQDEAGRVGVGGQTYRCGRRQGHEQRGQLGRSPC